VFLSASEEAASTASICSTVLRPPGNHFDAVITFLIRQREREREREKERERKRDKKRATK
jgi:hypothetical protein